MKQMGKVIGSSLFSLLLLLGLIVPVQKTAPVFQPMTVAADSLSNHLPVNGEVKGNGVFGYTTNYVCYGGSIEEEHAVQNGWHITAKNYYFSHGVEWLECWDTDDGDYYGWIDINYITFYSGNSSSSNSPVAITSISPRKGQVAGNGVYGYASSYACYSDGKQVTQHKVENAWHITAKNTCSSHGVTWYECWDTDDGDYYGWIDANYLSFYDTTPAPAQTQAPKQTVVVEKTVLITEPPKKTVVVEKTVLVTEPPKETVVVEKTVLLTEPPTETMIVENTVLLTETKEQTTTKAAAAIKLDGQSKNHSSSSSSEDSNLSLILIGAGILLLAGVSIGLIVLFVKKSKEKPTGSVQMPQFHNPWEDSNSPMNPYAGQDSISSNNQQMGGLVCPNCGAVCNDPNGKFCEQCGTPLQ